MRPLARLRWTWLCWAPLPLHVLALLAIGWGWRRSLREAVRHQAVLWRWALDYARRETP